eukprot:TRINITY_DN270_c0_g1_i1.p1 TRINITY_DN270_c0_g1~~TRINITY_DN270_c0_g1_i1.p1  ORF type:complete len:139 (+),score=38.79 TRINITY_DN270_c0_g1_i1:40-456(+)
MCIRDRYQRRVRGCWRKVSETKQSNKKMGKSIRCKRNKALRTLKRNRLQNWETRKIDNLYDKLKDVVAIEDDKDDVEIVEVKQEKVKKAKVVVTMDTELSSNITKKQKQKPKIGAKAVAAARRKKNATTKPTPNMEIN